MEIQVKLRRVSDTESIWKLLISRRSFKLSDFFNRQLTEETERTAKAKAVICNPW